ncbi:MAG: hypothetical protein CR997_11245 [Acidobacteria bacterium]|nr:MAG: hypothetical protein CR997_11245 [Acidobacteriota bacterium]
MEKLYLPKGSIIQGERISITHNGDICIANELVPLSIKSSEGSIEFTPEGDVTTCSHLLAENGKIYVSAKKLNAELISCQNLNLEIDDLDISQAIQIKERGQIKGLKLKTTEIVAGDLEIILDEDIEIQSIESTGDLVISAQNIKIDQIKAEKVSLEVREQMHCERLISKEDVYVSSGKLSIKFLDCASFTAAPEVTGIIMVATPEHVKAEGVRGFIRPQEFKVFANKDSFLQIPASGPSLVQEDANTPLETEVVSPDEEREQSPFQSVEVDDLEATRATMLKDVTGEAPVEYEEKTDPADYEESVLLSELNGVEETELPPPIPELVPPPYETVDVAVDEQEKSEPDPSDIESAELLDDPDFILEKEFDLQDHSLDDLSMETLNMDDEEELEEDQLNMDTVSEEAALSLNLGEAQSEIDSSFNDQFNDLDELSEQDELAIDSLEVPGLDHDDSNWEVAHAGEDLSEDRASSDQDEYAAPKMDLDDDSDSLEEIEELDIEDLSFTNFPLTVEEMEAQSDDSQAEEVMTEDHLVENLESVMVQIKECFPDENYPKFINQIEVYLAEKRFQILRKKRNKEAVISSFDRLDNPRVSELAREFYSQLSSFFQDEE